MRHLLKLLILLIACVIGASEVHAVCPIGNATEDTAGPNSKRSLAGAIEMLNHDGIGNVQHCYSTSNAAGYDLEYNFFTQPYCQRYSNYCSLFGLTGIPLRGQFAVIPVTKTLILSNKTATASFGNPDSYDQYGLPVLDASTLATKNGTQITNLFKCDTSKKHKLNKMIILTNKLYKADLFANIASCAEEGRHVFVCGGKLLDNPLTNPTGWCDQDNDGAIGNDDCDDQDSKRSSKTTEICTDGIDNDCDNKFDASDEDCHVPPTTRDNDHDGYCAGTAVCPDGKQPDCNDADINTHPGAYDIPGDTLDQDCKDGPAKCHITVSPASGQSEVNRGDSIDYTITLVNEGNYSEEATIYVTPEDTSIRSNDGFELEGNETSSLTLTALSDTDVGTYNINVEARSTYVVPSGPSGTYKCEVDFDLDVTGDDRMEDNDHDGYCEATREEGCLGPAEPGDCDDNDPTSNPGVHGDSCTDDADNDCDGQTNEGCSGDDRTDDDHDGYCENDVSCTGTNIQPGDCDDTDPDRNPGENEICGDQKDNNCDAQERIDEGCSGSDKTDDDDDGYCENATSCTDTSRPGDCDDTNPAVHPGALEICGDSLNNDCRNGADGRDCTITRGNEGVDNDGDRHCEAATCIDGSFPNDCNDTDAKINPDMTEICGDNKDNDCNGLTDELGCSQSGLNGALLGELEGGGCSLQLQTGTGIPAILMIAAHLGILLAIRRRKA